MTKARSAQVVGIVVATLNLGRFRDVVERLKNMCEVRMDEELSDGWSEATAKTKYHISILLTSLPFPIPCSLPSLAHLRRTVVRCT